MYCAVRVLVGGWPAGVQDASAIPCRRYQLVAKCSPARTRRQAVSGPQQSGSWAESNATLSADFLRCQSYFFVKKLVSSGKKIIIRITVHIPTKALPKGLPHRWGVKGAWPPTPEVEPERSRLAPQTRIIRLGYLAFTQDARVRFRVWEWLHAISFIANQNTHYLRLKNKLP